MFALSLRSRQRSNQSLADSITLSVRRRQVARLEEKLRAVIEAGRRLAAHGGAYDVVEANTKERGEVEAALKAARSSTKAAS